jgi:murein DD-endopeptidase
MIRGLNKALLKIAFAVSLAIVPLCASANVKGILSLQTISGSVGKDFVGSAHQAGLSPDNIRKVISVLDKRVDMGKLRPSDRFAILLAEEAGSRGELQIYAAKIVGERQDVVVVKYLRDGNFYDPMGRSLNGSAVTYFDLPIRRGRPTSLFSNARMHPILKKMRPHYGLDVAAPTGTPIFAAATGIVSRSDQNSGSGKRVFVLHKAGLETRYLHLNRAFVKYGDIVRKGDLIGEVGATGLATGPHLHWEVRVNGNPVDPVKALSVNYTEIPESEKGMFRQNVMAMLTKLDRELHSDGSRFGNDKSQNGNASDFK